MYIIPVSISAIEDANDRVFMAGIFKEYGRLMYAKAQDMLNDDQHAEDMVNEAFISLIAHMKILRAMERRKLKAYAVVTVRNACLDFIRKRNREGQHMFLDGDMTQSEVPADIDVVNQVIRDTDIAALKRAVRQLPKRQYRLLQMKYLDELSDVAIAEVMGIKTDSVRNALTLARRKVAALLDGGISR